MNETIANRSKPSPAHHEREFDYAKMLGPFFRTAFNLSVANGTIE
jgi:hypothetical protein